MGWARHADFPVLGTAGRLGGAGFNGSWAAGRWIGATVPVPANRRPSRGGRTTTGGAGGCSERPTLAAISEKTSSIMAAMSSAAPRLRPLPLAATPGRPPLLLCLGLAAAGEGLIWGRVNSRESRTGARCGLSVFRAPLLILAALAPPLTFLLWHNHSFLYVFKPKSLTDFTVRY